MKLGAFSVGLNVKGLATSKLFYDNFMPNGLKNDELNEDLNQKIEKAKAAI